MNDQITRKDMSEVYRERALISQLKCDKERLFTHDPKALTVENTVTHSIDYFTLKSQAGIE